MQAQYELIWAPLGQHLMVHETAYSSSTYQDWAIFAVPTGEWCGLWTNLHHSDTPPAWSSQGTLCLSGDDAAVEDLSANPPLQLQYFSRSDEMLPSSVTLVGVRSYLGLRIWSSLRRKLVGNLPSIIGCTTQAHQAACTMKCQDLTGK